MLRFLQPLSKVLAASALFALTSCNALGSSLLPAGLTEALGSVGSFGTAVGQFAEQLGPSLDAAGLGQLSAFTQQATDLGSTISGFQDQVSSVAADPLAAIGGQLQNLGGFDVNALKGLAGQEQVAQVEGFANTAQGVGKAATDFLKQFGG